MQQAEQATSFDDTMDTLANVQRRKLLVELLVHNPQNDSPVVIAGSDDETDVVEDLVMMRHAHLPKLADYGFIEWHEDSNEVLKGPNFEEIKPLLEFLEDHRDELPSNVL